MSDKKGFTGKCGGMGLGRKNLFYSMALAGSMLLFLLGYFICMLPSLYVDYVMEQNLLSVREQHDAYVRSGTYEGVAVRNSTACFSMEIPFEGNFIQVTGKAFSAEITVTDERLAKVLRQCREKLKLGQSIDLSEEMETLGEIFGETVRENVSLPVEIRLIHQRDMEGEFHNESIKVHSYSDTMFVLETSVEDSTSRYMNYIAIERRPDSLVLTYLPLAAPEMNEIRPIVMQSIPMLGAVILLMVLIFSQAYSKGIVTPIVKLVQYARQMKYSLDFSGLRKEQVQNSASAGESRRFEYRKIRETGNGAEGRETEKADCHGSDRHEAERPEDIGVERPEDIGVERTGSGEAVRPRSRYRGKQDEVRVLADTLEDFYLQIKENMRELEKKNRKLEEENKRQEIFLRASSHQLKTPIAAALLLLDGMIHEVGRYKDTKVYLPKVKEQLLSMRKMVEDILYLNHCGENMHFRQIELGSLLEERLQACQVPIGEKQLSVDFLREKSMIVSADELMLSQVLDNLLSNAVKYTPVGGSIRIAMRQGEMGAEHFMEGGHSMEAGHSMEGGHSMEEGPSMEEMHFMKWTVRIENFGAAIPEELLPHIFEPFVSGSHGEEIMGTHSHGLGLYIASCYAEKLGVVLSVRNGDGGERSVAASLTGIIHPIASEISE